MTEKCSIVKMTLLVYFMYDWTKLNTAVQRHCKKHRSLTNTLCCINLKVAEGITFTRPAQPASCKSLPSCSVLSSLSQVTSDCLHHLLVGTSFKLLSESAHSAGKTRCRCFQHQGAYRQLGLISSRLICPQKAEHGLGPAHLHSASSLPPVPAAGDTEKGRSCFTQPSWPWWLWYLWL